MFLGVVGLSPHLYLGGGGVGVVGLSPHLLFFKFCFCLGGGGGFTLIS